LPRAGQVPDRSAGKEVKVFWFFSSEKNKFFLQGLATFGLPPPVAGPNFACRWMNHCCAMVSVLFHDQ
jgi:hypothetical protein